MGREYAKGPKRLLGLCWIYFHSTKCCRFTSTVSGMTWGAGRVLTKPIEVEEHWMKASEKKKQYFRTGIWQTISANKLAGANIYIPRIPFWVAAILGNSPKRSAGYNNDPLSYSKKAHKSKFSLMEICTKFLLNISYFFPKGKKRTLPTKVLKKITKLP